MYINSREKAEHVMIEIIVEGLVQLKLQAGNEENLRKRK